MRKTERPVQNTIPSLLEQCPVFKFQPTPIHSLWLFLHKIQDPRSNQGKRRPLPVILLLTLLAFCCGKSTYEGIQDWACDYQDRIADQLPFLAGHTPDASTFHRVFGRLEVGQLEEALVDWLQTVTLLEKGEGISVDGKFVQNSELLLVMAFAHLAKSVLFQKKTGKGQELKAAPRVFEQIPLQGQVITGDALYTQKGLCQQITADGGGYVLTVKNNQKSLREDIQLIFTDSNAQIVETTTVDRHRGRVEKRTTKMTSELNDYLDWPGLTHVWQCTREVVRKGETRIEVVYGVASLLADQTVKDLHSLIRGHWSIENNLHRQRDAVFNENQSIIRQSRASQVMAALRNLVISLFNRAQVSSHRRAFRRFCARPMELFAFLGLYGVAS